MCIPHPSLRLPSVSVWFGHKQQQVAEAPAGLLIHTPPTTHSPRVPDLQAAVAGQLLTADQALQVAALQCLRPFKLPYLPPELLERLVRLADVRTLRGELVGFPLGPGAEGGLLEEQRPGECTVILSVCCGVWKAGLGEGRSQQGVGGAGGVPLGACSRGGAAGGEAKRGRGMCGLGTCCVQVCR